MIPEKEIDEVTRASGSTIINQIAEALPTYVSGSPDEILAMLVYCCGNGKVGSVRCANGHEWE